MARKSSVWEEMFKSMTNENNTNNISSFLSTLTTNGYIENLLKNGQSMNKVIDFIFETGSNIINPATLIDILDKHPNLTDELITKQINSFKEKHPQSNEIINKYLQSYEEKRSDATVYNIREFLRSDDCKKALNDPQMKSYLKEMVNSSDIKDKIMKFYQKQQ